MHSRTPISCCWQLRLIAVIVLLAMTAGCGSRSAEEIERVLAANAATTDGEPSVAEVVSRMRAIDLDGCPTEFQEAYLAHIHAWELAETIEYDIEAHNDYYNSWGAMLESLLRGMVLDSGMIDELKEAESQLAERMLEARQRIQATYQRVEQVAIANGAALVPRELTDAN